MAQSEEYLDFLSKYPSLLAIGNTPLARIDLPYDIGNVEILAKYEHLNPGGSI